MAMNVAQIRLWLLSQPRPVAIRVVTTDDERHEVAVGGNTWMKVAAAIHALSPARIEGFDAEGKLVKAVRADEEQPDTEEPDEGAPAPVKKLELPAGADAMVAMTSVLSHFADLLARAYEHTTNVAFERLAGMHEQSLRRSESLERSLDSLQRLMTKAARDKLEIEAAGAAAGVGGDGLLGQILQDFLAGQALRNSGGDAADHGPNGKAES